MQDSHPARFIDLMRRYCHPRHWPTWLGLALLWLIARLPLRLQVLLGTGLGRAALHLLPKRRHIAAVNLRLCFPELSEAAHRNLLREAFENNAIGYFEAGSAWFSRSERFRSRLRVSGLHHLTAAQSRGCGVLLLGGHYTTLDLGGALYDLVGEAGSMQRDHDNPLFNAVMTCCRERFCHPVIGKDDLRGLLRLLREGRTVWYATDQDYGPRNSVFAPFFGVATATLTATSRIAARTGAAVVPFSHFRLPDGGYELRFEAALTDYPSGDDLRDATLTNHVIEAAIRRFPGQYLWMHRRFKSEPDGSSHRRYGGKL